MKNLEDILSDKRIVKIYKNIETDKVLKIKAEIRSQKGSDKALVSFSRVLRLGTFICII